jgi:flagellar hook-associated protein 2
MAVTTDYLNALGAGSGLDTKSIVSAMVTAETAGKQASIDRRTEGVIADVSALAVVKSALSNLQNAFEALDDKNDFNFSSINNSGSDYVNATLDGTLAQAGSYNIDVNSLAMAEMRESLEFTSNSDDVNSGVGVSFTVQVASGTVETVTLAAGDVSLDNAAEAINNLDIGVSAWVVQTDADSYKLLTQGPTGADNSVTITDSNSIFGLNKTSAIVQSAADASVDINGVNVVRDVNTFDDLIPGVSIDLQATSVQSFNLSVGRDITTAQTTIVNLVEMVNAFNVVMDEVTAVEGTDGKPGALKSDSAIEAIEDKIRSIFASDSSTPGTNVTSLSDMGVTVQRDGTYEVDTTTLSTALKDNFDDVTKVFSANTNSQTIYGTADRGIAGDMIKQISDYLSSTGVITTRENSYKSLQSTLTVEQSDLDDKATAVEKRYTKQFITMNKIMDEMKSMQKYLDGQLSNLPFTAKND